MLFRLTAYTSSSPRTCHHPLSPDLHNSQLVRYPVGFGKPFQQVASWTSGSHNRQQTAMPWFGLDFRQYCPANNPLEYFTLCLTKVLVLPTHNRELRAGELRSVNAHYFDINQLLTAIITSYFFRLDRPSTAIPVSAYGYSLGYGQKPLAFHPHIDTSNSNYATK